MLYFVVQLPVPVKGGFLSHCWKTASILDIDSFSEDKLKLAKTLS